MTADIERLKKLLEAEGYDTTDERFVRALRKFQNPAGCDLCGANTKVGVTIPAKGKTPSYMQTACCKKRI